jgi:hypothetical protein
MFGLALACAPVIALVGVWTLGSGVLPARPAPAVARESVAATCDPIVYRVSDRWLEPGGYRSHAIVVDRACATVQSLQGLAAQLHRDIASAPAAHVYVFADERAARDWRAAYARADYSHAARVALHELVAEYVRVSREDGDRFTIHEGGEARTSTLPPS